MKPKNKIILSFDLDFTLIDNKKGIVNSFNYALERYNIPPLNNLKIEELIGIPLDIMFARVTDFETSLLTSMFRDYYGSKGIYQVNLFPDVIKKLEEFKTRGFILGVVTSKKQEMALKLLRYLEIDKYFDFILGETNERKSKIDYRLKEILFNKYPDYKFVVIGDHPNDKEFAEMLGCPFIGLLSGNHTAEQLKHSGTSKTIILKSIKEITTEKIYSLF
ncbi:MAG: HAD family hydrolase [Candidatus Hodarchaeota archaeon]